MSRPPEYDMESVRQAYAHLKARLANAKTDLDDVSCISVCAAHAWGRIVAYDFAIEQFLEIFGPCLEE